MVKEVIVEFIPYARRTRLAPIHRHNAVSERRCLHTWTVFKHKPDELFGHNDLVKPSDMRVEKLSMMVDLAREVRVIFVR